MSYAHQITVFDLGQNESREANDRRERSVLFTEEGVPQVSGSAGKLITVGFVCWQWRDRAAWKCALEEPKFRAQALNCFLEGLFLFSGFIIRILQWLVPRSWVGVFSGCSVWSLQASKAPHNRQQQCPWCVESVSEAIKYNFTATTNTWQRRSQRRFSGQSRGNCLFLPKMCNETWVEMFPLFSIFDKFNWHTL